MGVPSTNIVRSDSPDGFRTRLKLWGRDIVRTVLPSPVLKEIRRYRKYKVKERPVYFKLRLTDAIGLVSQRKRRPPLNSRSFLFVCFGNIMRSPMCEALMTRALSRYPSLDVSVSSAGLNATPGRHAHDWSISAAQHFGIALHQHRAQLLTPEMVRAAEVILVMDYQNMVELECRYPEDKQKVFMLSAFAGDGYRGSEIPDPYYGNEEQTRNCYSVLQICIDNLVSALVAADARNGGVKLENTNS